MTELKAYSVAERNAERNGEFQELVFAADHRRAKALAWGSGLFDCEFTDLRVVRIPRADQFAGDTARYVEYDEWQRIAWALHWQFAGELGPVCDVCSRPEYPDVPESQLSYAASGAQICADCRAAGQGEDDA